MCLSALESYLFEELVEAGFHLCISHLLLIPQTVLEHHHILKYCSEWCMISTAMIYRLFSLSHSCCESCEGGIIWK